MNPNTTPTYSPVKSSLAAGLLGIFLGSFGAHNWYLGNKKNGILHLAIWGGSMLVMLVSGLFLGIATATRLGFMAGLSGFMLGLGYIAMFGNSIWGLVEGIILLVQGDAGLAAKGYTVANAGLYTQAQQAPQTPTTATKPEEKK